MYRLGLGAEAMGPPVDPNIPVQPPDVQQQIADLWDSIFNMGQTAMPDAGAGAPAPVGQGVTAWLNANAGKVAIGSALFFGVLLVTRGFKR